MNTNTVQSKSVHLLSKQQIAGGEQITNYKENSKLLVVLKKIFETA